MCDSCFFILSGEYIALYQVQRSVLRQRAQEKDEQLSKLSKDREEMRNKLSELNELVHQLVAEKEAIRKISNSIPVEHVVKKTSANNMPEGVGGIIKTEMDHFKITVTVFVTYLKPDLYLFWCAYLFPFLILCCFF